MNVFFHVTAAIGVAVVFTDTNKVQSEKSSIIPAVCAFISGLIIHGIMDYMPHSYPIPPKVDAIISLLIILTVTFLSNSRYTLIIILAFLGSVFPDLVDLLPAILNKYIGFDFPYKNKLFPWHQEAYSGSIFQDETVLSQVNHFFVLLLTAFVLWCRRIDLIQMFRKEKEDISNE